MTDNIIDPLRVQTSSFPNNIQGETGRRQPVHTVYGGAHLFKSDSAQRLGALARRSLEEFAPDAAAFAKAIGVKEALAATIYQRVTEKLQREPVEDFRIDFEDGYGNRPDAEEDGHAVAAATEVATGRKNNTLPPFIGIRIKPFNEELRARSFRTLDLFVSSLVEQNNGQLPDNFVVTLPKITIPEQVAALVTLFKQLEKQTGLPAGSLKFEMMIETTQSIINHQGQLNLPLLLAAGDGRCVAAHFGTYDYTAGCSITAAHQHMLHAACDFREAHDASVVCGYGCLAFRWRDEHHARRHASRRVVDERTDRREP
jgi:citrate lyase beta subunit